MSDDKKKGRRKQVLSRMFFGFIPRWIGGKAVLWFYEFLRLLQKLSRRSFPENMHRNEERFRSHENSIWNQEGFIEDQWAYEDMAYGKTTMQYAGCEIIAVYNALFDLTGTYPVTLPEMIRQFEHKGMVLSGMFGTSPREMVRFLEKQGFLCETTTKRKRFDEMGKAYDHLILTMYNDRDDIRMQVHTVYISKEEQRLIAHNVYGNGTAFAPYDTMTELIGAVHNGKAKGISLIGIRHKA